MCVRYRLPDGSETDDFPAHQSDFHHCRPVWETLAGWEQELAGTDASRPPRRLRRVRRGRARRSGLARRHRRLARRRADAPLARRYGLVDFDGARPPRRLGRSRARARLEARAVAARSTELHAAPGNPGHRGARPLPPRARRRRARRCSASRARWTSTSSSSGPRRRSWRASRTCSVSRDPRLRAVRGGGAHRGLEDVREGRHGCRGCADGGDARRGRRAVRAEGGRPCGGQGRRRLPDAGRGRRRARRGATASPDRSSSRSCSTGPRSRVFAICDGVTAHALAAGAGLQARLRRRPRARTPAAWARTRPFRASTATTRRARSSIVHAGRSSRSSRAAGIRSSGRSSRG